MSSTNRKSYNQDDPPEREVKYTFWLLFSVLICVFGNSFLYGYNIGVVNSPAMLIKAFYAKVEFERDGVEMYFNASDGGLYFKDAANVDNAARLARLDPNSTDAENLAISQTGIEEDNKLELLWSVTVAIFVLFGMIGAFSSGKVADCFGRKKGMIIITFLMFLSGLFGGITTIAKSPECLIIACALAGLHCGINEGLAVLYIAEISPKQIRVAVGTCHQLFITVGILWSRVLGLPELLGTWEYWPILFTFNAVPALLCLVLFPLCPESPRFLLMKKNDEDAAKKALKRLRGYDEVEDDLEDIRVGPRRAWSIESFTLKKLLTTPKLKLPTIISCVLHFSQHWSIINLVDQRTVLASLSIIVVFVYVILFALGLGPISFIVVDEIFRQEPCDAAMSFSLAWKWICSFIFMLTFRFIQKGIDLYTFLIFIVILFGAIIVFFVLKMKNRPFDDIAQSTA